MEGQKTVPELVLVSGYAGIGKSSLVYGDRDLPDVLLLDLRMPKKDGLQV